MGYSFRIAARDLLYALSHRQDSTYHGLCHTSRGTLAGTRNSSMGSPCANALTTELHLAPSSSMLLQRGIHLRASLCVLDIRYFTEVGSDENKHIFFVRDWVDKYALSEVSSTPCPPPQFFIIFLKSWVPYLYPWCVCV